MRQSAEWTAIRREWQVRYSNERIIRQQYKDRKQQAPYDTATISGAAAEQSGRPITDCPTYTDPELARRWQIGWQLSDARLK